MFLSDPKFIYNLKISTWLPFVVLTDLLTIKVFIRGGIHQPRAPDAWVWVCVPFTKILC